jgi:hypothetical protein
MYAASESIYATSNTENVREPDMKAFLSAIIVALVMGIGASMILEKSQVTAEAKFSTPSVRN